MTHASGGGPVTDRTPSSSSPHQRERTRKHRQLDGVENEPSPASLALTLSVTNGDFTTVHSAVERWGPFAGSCRQQVSTTDGWPTE